MNNLPDTWYDMKGNKRTFARLCFVRSEPIVVSSHIVEGRIYPQFNYESYQEVECQLANGVEREILQR